MKKIINIFISISIVATTIIFLSCDKEKQNILNDSVSIYSKSTIDSLFNEPIVSELLSNLKKQNIKNRNNILEFRDEKQMNEVIQMLYDYSMLFKDSLGKYPDDPILVAFEKQYNFLSLRNKIEDEVIAFENDSLLISDEDPDSHYILSPYIRTILSPYSMVILNKQIYIIYPDFTIAIMNADLNLAESIYTDFPPEQFVDNPDYEDIAELDAENPNVIILSDGEFVWNANFSFYADPNNNLRYHLNNWSSGPNISDCSFKWEVNESIYFTNYYYTYSLVEQPIIELSQSSAGEEVEIILYVIYNNVIQSSCSRKFIVGDCISDFNFTVMPNNQVNFYSTSSSSSSITNYTWLFGDGQQDSGSDHVSTSHIYSSPGNYNVTLIIQTSDGCTNRISKSVNVEKFCCKRTGYAEKEYNYASNKKLIFKFHFSSIWPFSWITAKTTNYEKKLNRWRRARANNLGAFIDGDIYNSKCVYEDCVNNEGLISNNTKSVTATIYYLRNFRIANEKIKSKYILYNSGVNENMFNTGLKLHNKTDNCN